ncbi:G-protein coupled receptor 157-like [Actinia tenebrosa]|uniref:G-protein coupled receptor 157-like n=1 Tax=Actinia tenebrosa TaxID=6105 RepID=A0A6P8HNZ0_ACTTE|nr:G-protein coupled receptor 157-like [Actinia tenebrosa]
MAMPNATDITKASEILTSISASLSMVGAIGIIATYITWREIRSSPRKILVYISIADFFTAFGNMFSVLMSSHGNDEKLLCEAQSFITTCSSLWSFFWTTFLAIYLYCSVALRKPSLAERLLLFFTFFGWAIPLVITAIALGKGALGDDDNNFSAGWCWIKTKGKNKTEQLLWMLFTGKAWEIATYILIAVFYTALRCYIHKDITRGGGHFNSDTSQQSAIRAERKLTLVPVIFIFLRMWGTLRFILLQVQQPEQFDQQKLDFLVYLQGIGDSAQGFANFLLFCFFTEKFQKKLATFFFSCWKPKSSSVDESNDQLQKHKGHSKINKVDENSPLLSSMDRHP